MAPLSTRLSPHILLLFLPLLTFFTSKADNRLDSLWHVWQDQSRHDTVRLEALNEYAWDGYLFNQPDSAFYFAQMQIAYAESTKQYKYMAKALNTQGASFAIRNETDTAIFFYQESIKYHRETGYQKGVASVLNNIGNIFYGRGQYDKAIANYEESIQALMAIKDDKNVALAQSNIGNVYADQGDYANAIDYFGKSLQISERINDTIGIANAYNNMGIVYNYLDEYDKAIFYFEKSLDLYVAIGSDHQLAIAHGLNNLGNAYSYIKENDKALDYYSQSLSTYEKLGHPYNSANTLNNIGTIYFDREAYDSALFYFSRSLDIFESYEDSTGSITPLNNIGRIHFSLGNSRLALNYSQKALKIASSIGNTMGIKNASEFLYSVYKQMGNHRKALEMHELYLTARDSIQSEENQRKVIHQEFQYQYEKKVAADSLKAIEERLKTKAQIAMQNAQLEKERIQRLALYAGILVLLLFGGFILNRFKKSQAQKAIIQEQKEVVEEAHKEITDSIAYAKRIQSAILPPNRVIRKHLPKSFILYKPKDQVAGDFYWMEHKDGKVLFAAADCTGHGVPGAMVSVVCNNGLNRSVREFGLTDPGKILDKTREIVIKEFEKSDEEVKDGMDIALCSIESNKLTYAGANNPCWIIRNNELIEIKANKQPIGKYVNNASYDTHSFVLEKNDSIYIFSDGFVDQFGGPKNKKFKAKAFRDLLIEIQDIPMSEQEKHLDMAFEKWRGDISQIDDVCVMGVRIS